MSPTLFVHPLDWRGRQKDARLSSDVSDMIAPGLRKDQFRQLIETDPKTAMELLYSLQGNPNLAEIPIGGGSP